MSNDRETCEKCGDVLNAGNLVMLELYTPFAKVQQQICIDCANYVLFYNGQYNNNHGEENGNDK